MTQAYADSNKNDTEKIRSEPLLRSNAASGVLLETSQYIRTDTLAHSQWRVYCNSYERPAGLQDKFCITYCDINNLRPQTGITWI